MPSPKGLGILVRKTPITDEEWLQLIEARRQLIIPHLNSFTLRELGSHRCLRKGEGDFHEIYNDGPSTTGLPLNAQGIFHFQLQSRVQRIPGTGYRSEYKPGRHAIHFCDGVIHAWGLTRSGLWVLVTVHFVGEPGVDEYGYERATKVEIRKSDLPSIIKTTKEDQDSIWTRLGLSIREWEVSRRKLHTQALSLVQIVDAEELALMMAQRA